MKSNLSRVKTAKNNRSYDKVVCLLYTYITFFKGILVPLESVFVSSWGISENQGYFGNSMYQNNVEMAGWFKTGPWC